MAQQPVDDSNPAPALNQWVKAVLAEQLIGGDDSAFVIAEWTDPGNPNPSQPPQPIAPFHVHYADDEAWYVLEGSLTVRLGDQEVTVAAGGIVFAPRGTPHTYWNPQPTPTRYLLIMTPTIRRLIDALHAVTERDALAMAALFQQHQSALLPASG